MSQATEAQLRQAFEPAGFVWELTLPRSAGGRGRGFAFVGFTCKAHAERAIKLVNGQPLAGRPVAVDWAVSKAQFDVQQPVAAAAAAGGSGEPDAADLRRQQGIVALDSDLEGDDSEDDDDGDEAGLVSEVQWLSRFDGQG